MGRNFDRNVTKLAPQKALNLITAGAYSDAEVRAMGGDARRVVVVQRTGTQTAFERPVPGRDRF